MELKKGEKNPIDGLHCRDASTMQAIGGFYSVCLQMKETKKLYKCFFFVNYFLCNSC